MFIQRLITALVLAPLMLAGIYLLPDGPFSVFIGFIVVLGVWEWANLAGYAHPAARIGAALVTAAGLWWLDALLPPADPLWQLLTLWSLPAWALAFVLVLTYPAGQAVIRWRPVRLLMAVPVLLPLWSGLKLLKLGSDDTLMLTWLMLLVWGADIGAYFAGRTFGHRKLAPAVSPGKTWAGVYGGMATSMLVSLVIAVIFLPPLSVAEWAGLLVISAAVVAVSVLGDLLESLLKRFRGIKDSSRLLPGHGGVLDRIDSLCAATPMFCLLLAVVS